MPIFWQIVASNAVVAAVLALSIALLGRCWKNPVGLHLLWVLVLVKLLTPPVVVIPIPWLADPSVLAPRAVGAAKQFIAESQANETGKQNQRNLDTKIVAAGIIVVAGAEAARENWTRHWQSILAWTWIGGIAVFAVSHAYRICRFQEVLRCAQRPSAAISNWADEISKRLGLGRVPGIVMLPVRFSPLVWSVGGRPRVLLPGELFELLSPDAQRTILAHELIHVRRRDHWVRLLELITTTLFWWHPVVWWACRELRVLEEQCCDQRVVGLMPELARAYAEAMLATVEFLAGARPSIPLGASGFSQVGLLKRRIEMVKEGSGSRRLGWPLRCALSVSGAVVLLFSITALRAEPSPTDESDVEKQPQVFAATEKPNTREQELERRLERMEALVETLVKQLQSRPGPAAEQPSPSPAKKEATATGTPTTTTESAPETTATESIIEEDLEREAWSSLVDLTRSAVVNMELSKTLFSRWGAAERQFKAVTTAFEAETVTADQLLDAQRRLAEARVAYVRSVSALADGTPKAQYVSALGSLAAANQSLKNAREVWAKVHRGYEESGGEAKEEAQAREQFFQFKLQTQKSLDDYVKAKKAWETGRSPQSD